MVRFIKKQITVLEYIEATFMPVGILLSEPKINLHYVSFEQLRVMCDNSISRC